MEAQTLQQQVPVYHVCQQCNGAGCQACSDLLILDGDIQLDPEWSGELPEVPPCDRCPKPCSVGDGCRYVSSLSPTNQEQLEWLDAFSERVQLLTAMAPINGVIGTTPDYPFSTEARLASVNKLVARMPYRSVRSEDNRVYLEGCGIWSDK